MATFDLTQGIAAIKVKNERVTMFLAIVMGVILHFVWEVLVAAVKDNVDPDFGSWGLILARVGIAVIVAMVSFVGIYKQLESAPAGLRFFVAVTQGFALDALTSPVGPASSAS